MSADGTMAGTRTTCPYCGVGCGVVAKLRPDGRIEISGDTQHPANFGRLCSKGSALGETLRPDGRLLQPTLRDAGGERTVGWDEALDTVADGFRRIIDEHGPDAVALYVSGQLLTEDYYVANKLVKAGFGTANIDTNSRLCMSSAVAGHVRAFGEDVVPCSYSDLEAADLIVLVGSNAAWCHPVLFQRIQAARERRPEMKLVVIDPRRTSTCEVADLHLPLQPGSDVALFNGLLAYLQAQGAADEAFIAAATEGSAEALAAAGSDELADVAARCGLDVAVVEEFFALWRGTERVVTAFSMGVNQSSAGTDKVNAIINCHLLTGRIGKPGMGPFSITGQPNAMGGREVGGLANMLAAHLSLDNPEHRALVQRYWNSPRIAERPGLKAVELFEAVGRGEIKAVWIIATNPIVSLPNADAVRAALAGCELVVVSDCIGDSDTARLADVLLPAAAWGEKDGTVTNSERRISRQRPFLPLPADARPDWWILSEFARRMGYSGFDYQSAHDIFLEHAGLSAYANDGDELASTIHSRRFNLRALSALSEAAYDALEPRQWPALEGASPELPYRLQFSTPSGKARLFPVTDRAPQNPPSEVFPLVLNTGRIRDQWHTMTRTGLAPRLAGHLPVPFAAVHPEDGAAAGIKSDDLIEVETSWGRMVVTAKVGAEVTRGTIFVPIHWSDTFASKARVGALVNPVVDAVSGEPEFKHTPALIRPWSAAWRGLLLTREQLKQPEVDWWARAAGGDHHRYLLAGREVPNSWSETARSWLGAGGEWIELVDEGASIYRAALLREGRLEACLFIAPSSDLPTPDWLGSLFAQSQLSQSDRAILLSGRASTAIDSGPQVCACFGVGQNQIVEAIKLDGLTTPQQIGKKLRAGTNCGSCIPELKNLIARCAGACQAQAAVD